MHTKPNPSFDNIQVAFASKSDGALKKMLWVFRFLNNEVAVNLGMGLAKWSLRWQLPVKGLLRKTVFSHFCGGESIKDCSATIADLGRFGIGSILDYSVEGEEDEEGFDQCRDEILRTIQYAASSSKMSFSVFKISGIGDKKILSRIQINSSVSEKDKAAFEKVKQRLDQLCRAAFEQNVKILVDGEESWFQDVVDELSLELMEKYNRKTAVIYNTYQMYRKDMTRKLKDAHHDAVAKGFFLGAKLVRGAYMDKEARRAKKKGYLNPIHPSKAATDQAFNDALLFCINNKQRIYLVSGTHNELSNIILPELMLLHGLKQDDERVYFAQLYGMGDHISYNLSNSGYNVVKYLPYGPVEAVMPYLSRRAAENKSISDQSNREIVLIKKELARRKAVKTNHSKE